nr:hypothetical protein [Tanacetum cinerariifolium]
LIKSWWMDLVRNILLMVLNEITNGGGLKLLDVIVKNWKIISSSTYPRGMQQSAEVRKNLSEKKKKKEEHLRLQQLDCSVRHLRMSECGCYFIEESKMVV